MRLLLLLPAEEVLEALEGFLTWVAGASFLVWLVGGLLAAEDRAAQVDRLVQHAPDLAACFPGSPG